MKTNSDKKDSLKELKMRQAYLEGVLESAPDAIVTLDSESRVTGWNKGAEKLFGYRSSEAMGKNIDELVASGDSDTHKEALGFSELVASDQTVEPIETIRYHKDGRPLHVILSGSPVSVNGKNEGSVAVYTDITERVRAEETLAESHERLLTILNSIDADIYVADMDTHEILFINQHMRENFGNDLVGKICWQEFRGGSEPCPHCTNDQLLDADGNPVGVVVWEGQNPITGKWYSNFDRAINWLDGRTVRIQVATDITQLVRAREALEVSEKRLLTAGKAAYDLIYEWDVRNNTLEWFGDIDGLLGYKTGEISRTVDGWLELIHPDDKHDLENAVDFHRTSTEAIKYEYRVQHQDGSYRYWEDRGLPLLDDKGKPHRWVGVCRDITERKQTEQALRENQDFLKSVFDAIQDGISVSDADLNVLVTNRWMEERYSNQLPLTGRKCYHVYQQRSSICPWCPTTKTIETGEPHTEIVPYPTADKIEGWIELSAFPVKDEQGEVTNVIEYVKDISERKRAEEALSESEEKYRELFKNSNDGIILHGLDGSLIDVNQSVLELFGYSRSEILGLKISDLHPREALKKSEKAFEIISKKGSVKFEIQFQKKDGVVFPAEVSSSLFELNGVQLVQGIIRDITARVRAVQEVRQHSQNLELINTINTAINRGQSLPEIIQLLTNEAKQVFDSLTTTIYLVSEDKKCLELQRLTLANEVVKKLETLIGIKIPEFKIPLDENSLSRKILRDGKPKLFNTAEEIQSWMEECSNTVTISEKVRQKIRKLFPQIYTLIGVQSLIIVPLVLGDEPIGLLEISRKKPFTQADVVRSVGISGQLTSAIQRMQMQEKLEYSLKTSSDLMRFIPSGMFIYEHEAPNKLFLIDGNQSAEKISGIKISEWIGKEFNEIWPTAEESGITESFLEVMRTGDSFDTEDLHYKDKRLRGDFRVRAFRLPHDRLAVSFEDISERKRAEHDLQESEERYRVLVENAFDGIYLMEDKHYEYVNDRFCEITGYSRQELCSTDFDFNVLLTDKSREIVDAKYKARQQGQNIPFSYEAQIKTKSGRTREVEISTMALQVGGETRILGILRDVTEQIQTKVEISNYLDRIEALLEIEKAISSSLDLDKVLETIMVELNRLIPHDSISIQLLRDESLEILSCRGFEQAEDVIGLVFPLDPKFPNYPVINQKKVLAIEDVLQNYPHFRENSDKYASGNIRSWLGVPLVSKGSVNGMIALDRKAVDPFSETEIEIATAIANQAALAIENAHLFTESQRRLEQLSSLRHIDQTISSSMDLRLTLNIILGYVVQQLEVDAAAILLYRPALQNLEFVAGQGFRTQALQFTKLRLGEGFAGKAALERRIVSISDMNKLETGFLRSPEFRNEGFVSYIGAPLLAKGNVTGVLEIYHRQTLHPHQDWMAFLETLAGQAAIAIENINLFEDLQFSNQELMQAYDATIEGWANALELRDMETEGHSRRVVEMTMNLSQKLNISDEDLNHIRRGAMLHDIGKMGVPDSILQKPGKLTDNEWEKMKQHPVHAFKWLSRISYLRPALDIPYCHHEKWDGTGYPQGLKDEQIPLAARIFAVVDVWDALLSDRPYRKAWPKKKVFEYLEEQSGIHFDPKVTEAFFELIGHDQR